METPFTERHYVRVVASDGIERLVNRIHLTAELLKLQTGENKRVSYEIPGNATAYCFPDGTKTLYPVKYTGTFVSNW